MKLKVKSQISCMHLQTIYSLMNVFNVEYHCCTYDGTHTFTIVTHSRLLIYKIKQTENKKANNFNKPHIWAIYTTHSYNSCKPTRITHIRSISTNQRHNAAKPQSHIHKCPTNHIFASINSKRRHTYTNQVAWILTKQNKTQ